MEKPKPLTQTEIHEAFVEPHQDAYFMAILRHNEAEGKMKCARQKYIKEWAARNNKEIKSERRDFLGKKQMYHLLHPDNIVLCPSNLHEIAMNVEKSQGANAVDIWEDERLKYDKTMEAYEERFDFKKLQEVYIDARRTILEYTYRTLDMHMQKLNPEWKGFEDLRDENLYKNEEIAAKNQEIKELKKDLAVVTANNMRLESALYDSKQNGENEHKKRKSP